jgi:hypothetical protein
MSVLCTGISLGGVASQGKNEKKRPGNVHWYSKLRLSLDNQERGHTQAERERSGAETA